MNEFVEQFLIECRELVEQGTDDLLTLEGAPDDQGGVDGAFRAFHTLKGAAGIVDFDAMGRALHAAEDVLSTVRTGSQPATPEIISVCLACLDQVVQWLDAMEAGGEIPVGADVEADVVISRFKKATGAPALVVPIIQTDWAELLVQQRPASGAGVAIRYAPEPDAFFRGEDPLAVLEQIPGLIGLEVLNAKALPALEDLDPFASHLVFGALADCTAEAARSALRGVIDQVHIVTLSVTASATGPSLSDDARGLLEAQLLLLAETAPEGLIGRLASAGRVSANVLKHADRAADTERLQAVCAKCLAARDPAPLIAALQRVLTGSLEAPPSAPAPAALAPIEATARTLRVDVERIDALVSLAGELMVAKNALGHAAALAHAGAGLGDLPRMLKDQHASLGRLVDELQRSVLNVRVLPMRYVFQRFPRLVREMVVSLGKPAQLITEGDETEADKAVVESLFEPLLHVLRNALDHGVETPAARATAGKPASATVRLRAAREGEHVIIEITDDGGGIDVARVRKVAEERGVAGAEALEAMTDQAVMDLVFAPGFSTAAKVTALSGRGVGMDAVRSSIEGLGGKVTIKSRRGEGATVRFALPFAVMMSRVLTVEAGGQMFGIPIDAIQETARINRDRILPIGAAQAFVLRDRTIPVIDLAQILGAPGERPSGPEANIVIASIDGQVGGLEVARLGDRLDVMLKPMTGLLSGMPGIAGTTLLGDGRVLIVLDVRALLQ
jgi:two-component system chemotaxis sensor kinase CheA